jgi:DNA-binding response OmpR family regulator
MARILIVEDEKPINNLIMRNLSLVGHECTQLFDGESAVKAIWDGKFDLVLLDVMLPGLSGFEILPRLQGLPVIFVTAKAGVADRLRGLQLGADDYITKPFEVLELVERVKAVLRRTKGEAKEFSFDDIRVELSNRRVFKGGEEVLLKPKEFDLLETFIHNRNIALSREKLIELVWNFDFEGESRTVDVHVQRLRRKLGISHRLQTVYKTGYRLQV